MGAHGSRTFDDFVVGRSNKHAHAAALAAASGDGRRHRNPVFIWGRTGTGKTHLLQAIGHQFRTTRSGSGIVHTSVERFAIEFSAAIRRHRLGEFRARHRRCDLLLVPGVHALALREEIQPEFYATLRALQVRHAQIVVTPLARSECRRGLGLTPPAWR